MAYRVASDMGFRRADLASLAPANFDLDADPPTPAIPLQELSTLPLRKTAPPCYAHIRLFAFSPAPPFGPLGAGVRGGGDKKKFARSGDRARPPARVAAKLGWGGTNCRRQAVRQAVRKERMAG